ncbi:hypothetical protein D3C80_1451250 [compost metagenome]
MVITMTISAAFMAPAMESIITTEMIGTISGRVMRVARWKPVAPSIAAASSSSPGIARIAASTITM